MDRSRWTALALIVFGVSLLVIMRLFLPLTDAELRPHRAADYARAIAAAVTGIGGLATLLVGFKRILGTPRGREKLRF